jgi:hypothetical protein
MTTTTTSKRFKTAGVHKKSIEQASAFLQTLPAKPKENWSLREAVYQLRGEIKAALAKGYSYEDLSSILTDKGVGISASTLKNYVPSSKQQAAKDLAAKEQDASTKRIKQTRNAQEEEYAIAEPAVVPSLAEGVEEVEPTSIPTTRRRTRSTTAAKEKTGTRSKATEEKRSMQSPSFTATGTRRGRKKAGT